MLQKKTLGENTGNNAANGAQQGPSLLTLAQQRQQATSGTSLATGTRTPGGLSRLAGLGATPPSPSPPLSTLQPTTTPPLSALASSSSAATGTGVRRSLTHLAKPASPASTTSSSSSPSLASLSSSTAPRRSLAGLGTRSTPQPSSATSALGSTSLTLGLSNGPLGLQARSGAGLLGSSRLHSKDSPTLAELSRQRLQQPVEDSKPEAQALEPSQIARKPDVFGGAEVTAPQTSQPTAVSSAPKKPTPSTPAATAPSSTPTPSISACLSSSTFFDHEAASPAVSLIAPPSHFALSIFAKLEPVPSTTMHTTLSSLSSSPYGPVDTINQHLAHSKTNLDSITVFQFNEPSPDDVVFKAQGHRALQPGSLAKS
ncbi:hypothetical protein BG006_006165 [Podila minutissima]|uniref:Uncharacterized protein n=1 Tax=Podila minutissima TaxID=64525 RepID=A0A9P5VQZ6_9FUNG|nr:hypothetical protein BG006_006165 [Podila minutissima]